MNEAELRRRVENGEDLHTEFKRWPARPDDLAAAIVAFANTDGGDILLGVADDGDIIGVPEPGRVNATVDQIAYQNCQPPVTVVQESVRVGESTVLVVRVPRGDQRPYATIAGLHYVRTSSGRRRASRQELQRLFQAAESLFYDETVLLAATLDDLDAVAIERFVAHAFPAVIGGTDWERVLLNLRLARQVEGVTRPTVAALLFFGREPQRFLPQAHIAAARVPGVDLAAAPSDVKRLEGRLPTMLEDAERFLYVHLPVPHRIAGFGPEALPELPGAALREALVNALAHRDYTVPAPVRLLIFDDRVEVRTPGGLPNGVTVEAMKLGAVHVLRNPTIYLLFERSGMVTGIGSGVYRLLQLVRQATGREAEIAVQGNEVVVSLPRPPRGG